MSGHFLHNEIAKRFPTWPAIRGDFGRLGTMCEASYIVIVPGVRMMHHIAMLAHAFVVILELV